MEIYSAEVQQASLYGKSFPKSHFSCMVTENPALFNFQNYGEIVRSVYISTKYKYVYFDIPKNASSSIKTFLYRLEYDMPNWGFTFFAEIHDRNFSPLLNPLQVPSFKSILDDPTYLLFCVFRNPAERLLSSYLDQIVTNKQYAPEIKAVGGEGDDEIPSFSSFVYWLCTLSYSSMDPHMMPQYIKSYAYAIPRIRIFSFEKLEELQFALSSRAGSPQIALPEVNQHRTNSTQSLDKYYTAEIRSAVEQKFADDIAIWKRLSTEQIPSNNNSSSP